MKTLELQFSTAGGGTLTLAVPDPMLPVNVTAVANVMDEIVSRAIFDTQTGPITAKKGARLVDHQTEDIVLK